MDKIIFKYELGEETRCIPTGKPVLVAQQFDNQPYPTLWVEHSTADIEHPTRDVIIVGTGMGFNAEGWEHVGSAICGAYVWHVYWRPL